MNIRIGELEYHGLNTLGFFEGDPYFVDDCATEYRQIKQIRQDSAHLYRRGKFFDHYDEAKRYLRQRGLLDLATLRKVAAASCDWPANTGYTQIGYNPDTGAVCYEDHGSQDNWIQWDPPVVTVLNTALKVTDQEIVNAIMKVVDESK